MRILKSGGKNEESVLRDDWPVKSEDFTHPY